MDVIALDALTQRTHHGWLNLTEPEPARHRRTQTPAHPQLQGQVRGKVRHRKSPHTVQYETGHTKTLTPTRTDVFTNRSPND